ncbi:bifunctional folylpolyglutamate synthase/dihydrofolate synthase [bacterium]|nr:bifunctional folylpolyglutamate synthase/dihydrofolate synthase [bacterium]
MILPQNEDYLNSINFLFSLFKFGIKLGLQNIQFLLKELGNPEKKIKTVHVAGTNGKGSTGAMLQSILRQSGYRTAFYTSPHLVDFRERIRIDGKPIPEKTVNDFVKKMKTPIQTSKATFFEATTALAFDYFAEEKVDVAVIEVGLGGNYDSTNVIFPEISVITDIGFDHTEVLGDTLEKIAGEKAGIIKPNTPILTSNTESSVLKVIENKAKEQNAEFIALEKCSKVLNLRNQNFEFEFKDWKIKNLNVPFLGNHQIKNSKLAIAASLLLSQEKFTSINEETIKNGLKLTKWHGRFTILEEKPTTILDVAHNADGFRAFFETLNSNFPDKKCFAVVGMSKDKEVKTCLEILEKRVEKFVCVTPKVERVLASEEMAKFFPDKSIVCGAVLEGMKLAKTLAKDEDLICVIGSHYTVGEAFEEIYKGKDLII